MSGLDSLDWSSIKFETQKMESHLGEWFLKGEVTYLQGWAFAFAERKAEYLGIPSDSKRYFQLQAMTRYKVFKEFYRDFQEKINSDPKTLMGLECKLVKYSDIDRLIEEDLEILTRPSKEAIVEEPEQRAYREIKRAIGTIEVSLSEYITREEICLLRDASLDYAEKRARKFNLRRGSNEYNYLHAFVMYELMSEVEEFVLGFPQENIDKCSELAHNFLEHNDLDFVLNDAENLFVKK